MNIKFSRTSLYVTTILIFCALWLSACQSTTSVVPTPTSIPTSIPTQEASVTPTVEVASTSTPALGSKDIRIKKYPDNYTAFKIEVVGGPTIITDPFVMDEKTHADIVTESHQHGDHTDVSSIFQPYQVLKEPGDFNLAGIKITGVGGVHNKPASFNLYNPNVIFVFDLGDIRLAQFGSQGEVPTPSMFAQIGKVDVLIIQVFSDNITKLNMFDAEKIVKQLSPQVIIPAHGSPGLNEELATLLDVDFLREPSGILELSRSALDQMEKPVMVVLDH